MKYAALIGFVLMVSAQWYAPLSMILESETTIDDGEEFRFKTRPVDPSDPFRGKYITLDFEAENYKPGNIDQLNFPDGSLVYVTVEEDPLGFAHIQSLSADPPETDNFFSAEFQYTYDNTATLHFPFKRFYLEETKASEAEQLYWSSRSDTTMVCFAKVKILKGDAKLVDVVVNDSSIVDIVRRINAGKAD